MFIHVHIQVCLCLLLEVSKPSWTISFWHMAEGDEAFARVFRVSHVLNFIFVGLAYLLSVQVVVPRRHMCAKPSTTRPQLQFEV